MAAADSVHAIKRSAHRARSAPLIHRDESSVYSDRPDSQIPDDVREQNEKQAEENQGRIPFQDPGVGAADRPLQAFSI